MEILKTNEYRVDYIYHKYITNNVSEELLPLVEIIRHKIVRAIKSYLNNLFKKNNLNVDINNIFPRWLMHSMANIHSKNRVDPIIPYKYNDYLLIENDLKVLYPRRSDISKILNDINLEKFCNTKINRLIEYINSDKFKNSKIRIIKKDNDKFIKFLLFYNNKHYCKYDIYCHKIIYNKLIKLNDSKLDNK